MPGIVQKVCQTGFEYVDPVYGTARNWIPFFDGAAQRLDTYVPSALTLVDSYADPLARKIPVVRGVVQTIAPIEESKMSPAMMADETDETESKMSPRYLQPAGFGLDKDADLVDPYLSVANAPTVSKLLARQYFLTIEKPKQLCIGMTNLAASSAITTVSVPLKVANFALSVPGKVITKQKDLLQAWVDPFIKSFSICDLQEEKIQELQEQLQKLEKDNQTLKEDNQALKVIVQHLNEENDALRQQSDANSKWTPKMPKRMSTLLFGESKSVDTPVMTTAVVNCATALDSNVAGG